MEEIRKLNEKIRKAAEIAQNVQLAFQNFGTGGRPKSSMAEDIAYLMGRRPRPRPQPQPRKPREVDEDE